MSPAEHARHGVLFIVVGAQRVECGVLVGGQWNVETVRMMRNDVVHGIGAPIAALAQIESSLSVWGNAPDSATQPVRPRVCEVRAIVADVWLSVSGVPWSASLKRAGTAIAFARSQLAAAGFELESDDVVKLDDAPFGQPRLAVGYPAALLNALARLTESLGARLTSVLPFSVAAWSRGARTQRGKAGALALLDEGLALVAHGVGRLTDVTVRADRDEGSDSTVNALRSQWRRMQVRDPQLSRVERLAVLSLSSPGAFLAAAGQELAAVELLAHHDADAPSLRLQLAACLASCRLSLDAFPARPGMTPARWALAGAALLLAGLLTWQALQTAREAQALGRRITAAHVAGSSVSLPTAWSREDIARVKAVNGAIRELNLPISALLYALQPPPDIRVAVLSVEVMGAASNDQNAGVKIVAEARTGADMARYVAFVAERKPFSGASLTRHEINESAAERPYRFTLEAVWSE